MKDLVVAASTGLLFAHAALREQRLDPANWERQLRSFKRNGFTAVDLSELWLPMADLTAVDVQRLGTAIAAAGLETAGVSIVDIDLARPARVAESRDKVLRGIEVAKALGASFLSLGFHALPMRGPVPDRWVDAGDGEHERIGHELGTLANAAAARGIGLTLEMFERGILDRSANVLAIIAAAGSGALGANPDLGNLLRAPWALTEEWSETVERLAPHLNYWHVKNGMRMQLPDGSALYQPTDIGRGTIDYRSALTVAVRNGFRGPLVIEHYGGDAIAQAAEGRAYLERVIADVCALEQIDIKVQK